MRTLPLILLFLALPLLVSAEPNTAHVKNGILYDEQGQEVALFGVNYSTPFAFGYRALNKLGIDHKDAIRMDVNHFKRMGATAYRVHLWDRELSDKDGNLLNNEHLQLFDFLLAELEKHDIRVIVTMISWWGSGYPEPDPATDGFSTYFKKTEMNQKPAALKAQKKYIQQLLHHRNPITGKQYFNDPNILAFELFNEPHHQLAPEKSAAYVEELISAAKDAGVKKPLFYNTSEQGLDKPFSEALCGTRIDGVAYQWYPSGLVANSTRQLNGLLNVAHYPTPFDDLPGCSSKAKMVYEFDAADLDNASLYPAMARSFREAGFQWATLFAYDPGHLAYANSEYNTHFLNLLYTPNKAIGFLVASEVFYTQKGRESVASYPSNNNFGNTQLDFHKNLALYNSKEKFFYSSSTQEKPKSTKSLKHIAGVGSSRIVNYSGTGAYFLDQLEPGVWQLEIYPDWIKVQDPHQNSSLRREVGRLFFNSQNMQISLPDLGKNYFANAINPNNDLSGKAKAGKFSFVPGKYLLSKKKKASVKKYTHLNTDYLLPKTVAQFNQAKPMVWHQQQRAASLKDNFSFNAQVSAANTIEKVELVIRYKGWREFHALEMQHTGSNLYTCSLPQEDWWKKSGPLEYAIVVTSQGNKTAYPGGVQGSPMEWDFVDAGYFHMDLQPWGAPISLLDPARDNANLIYPKDAHAEYSYVAGQSGRNTALRLGINDIQKAQPIVKTSIAADNSLKNRTLSGYNTLLIKVRSQQKSEFIRVGLLDKDGFAYSKKIDVKPEWQYVMIPLKELQASTTILSNAYPKFLPANTEPAVKDMWGKHKNMNLIQGLQFVINEEDYAGGGKGWHEVWIEEVSLLKR